jgi:hypothetical protein
MKFYAIAYKYQEDVFYNLATDEDTMDLTEQCLLPTEALAQQLIKERLEDSYTPVEIEIESLSKQGVMSWSRNQIEEWDGDF